jgi:predicted enzyme related to lactoylglutathione lyase
MGQPVVHFEIIGTDGAKLREYYGELFGWAFNADNPMNYGTVARKDNLNPDGIGIGGGVAGYEDAPNSVTFYVQVPDVEAALVQAESLGGKRLMGPVDPTPEITIGQFADPEGNVIGVVNSAM